MDMMCVCVGWGGRVCPARVGLGQGPGGIRYEGRVPVSFGGGNSGGAVFCYGKGVECTLSFA